MSTLLVCVLALAAEAAAETVPYQVGNYVVVVQETTLQGKDSEEQKIPPGTFLTVEELDGKLLGVTAGRKGWVNSADVASPERAVQKFTEQLEKDSENVELRRARVAVAYYTHDWDMLLEDFSDFIKRFPEEPIYYYHRAQTRMQKRQRDLALEDFNACLKRDPTLMNALLARSRLLQEKAEWQKSIDDLNAVLKEPGRKENRTYALALRGYAWSHLRDWDKAMGDYNAALELDPQYEKLHRLRGKIWHMRHFYDQAIADFSTAIVLGEGDAELYAVRGEAYRMQGDLKNAERDLKTAVEMEPNDPVILSLRGSLWRGVSEFDKAIVDYSRCIELKPKDSVYYGSRGSAYCLKHEFEKADADLAKALELNPKSAYAILWRGRVRYFQDKFAEAIEDYAKALEIDPDYLEVRGAKILAHCENGEFEKAEADVAFVAEKEPKSPWVSYNQGAIELQRGRPAEAVANFDETLRRDPNWRAGFVGRAAAWLKQREFAKALADARDALKRDSSHVLATNLVAWIYATCPDESLRDGKRALELTTRTVEQTLRHDPTSLAVLAAAFAETGDFEKAIATQVEAIKVNIREKRRAGLQASLDLYRGHKAFRSTGDDFPE